MKSTNQVCKAQLFFFALISGLSVANLYYNQPLLVLLSQTFHQNIAVTSSLFTAVQFAYAMGLILFVPLGDLICRKKLIFILLVFNGICSLSAAFAINFTWLILATIGIGLTSISAQIIIPAVSILSSEKNRGTNVSSVITGLFCGILLARTFSGFIGNYFGWRTMYAIAACINIFLILLVAYVFPKITSTVKISYVKLLSSLFHLCIQEKILWKTCLCGALVFSAFSALWGGLAYLLFLPPYHYGSDLVGLFGLIGLVGMFATRLIGKLSDIIGGHLIVSIGALIICISFIFLWYSLFALWILFVSLICLDLGSRMNLIGNQLQLLALSPELRSRLNTVFMAFYFLGGAIGARIGGALSAAYGWHGIGLFGFLIGLVTLILNQANIGRVSR